MEKRKKACVQVGRKGPRSRSGTFGGLPVISEFEGKEQRVRGGDGGIQQK